MKREIMLNVLRQPAKYPMPQIENAGFQAAELLDKGGTVGADGSVVFATPSDPTANGDFIAREEVVKAFVPKQTADILFNSLCQILELLDQDAWTNPRGVDFRTMPTFHHVKTMVLANIVQNMRAAGTLQPVTPGDNESMPDAALRQYGADSPEFFYVCAERYLNERIEASRAEALAVSDGQKMIVSEQVQSLPPTIAIRESGNDDAPSR